MLTPLKCCREESKTITQGPGPLTQVSVFGRVNRQYSNLILNKESIFFPNTANGRALIGTGK